jgi:hypothetical protein
MPLPFLFAQIEKPILKFIWNFIGPQKAKTILKKKNEKPGMVVHTCSTSYSRG